MLVRVVAPHFVAGLEITDNRCVMAAPILRWALGMQADEIRHVIRTRRWRATIVWP